MGTPIVNTSRKPSDEELFMASRLNLTGVSDGTVLVTPSAVFRLAIGAGAAAIVLMYF
jgi:hypothetical protein